MTDVNIQMERVVTIFQEAIQLQQQPQQPLHPVTNDIRTCI